MTKPIRVFHSGLTNTIYACRNYSDRGNGLFVSAAGAKDDVTQEAIAAVIHHARLCVDPECLCLSLATRRALSRERIKQ